MDLDGEDATQELRLLKGEARWGGGPERIAARRRAGRGTARERVIRLLDPNSFVELDVFVEGVVTGHGKVAGRDVYVFSEDGEVPAHALGEDFTRKIAKVMDLAVKNGAPLVGMHDRGGAWGWDGSGTGGEAGDADVARLGGHADVFRRSALVSGVVPQIAAVMGPCVGAAAFSPALADVVIMVKGGSHVLLGDRAALKARTGGALSLEEWAGARTLSEKSGVAHLAADDEAECLDMIARALSYLPQNNLEETPLLVCTDPVDRRDIDLESLTVGAGAGVYDMRQVIAHVVDEGDFFELMPRWARNLTVGFARLGGRAVGVVGNQPAHLDGRLDQDAAAKGARFVRLCDAFNLPVVALVDCPGCVSAEESGDGRLVREAAKLMYAFCEATVPKLTVIIRRAYAEGFELMGSRHTGTDFTFAWPSAEISPAAPNGALDRKDSASPYNAALAGHLDDIVEPAETRPRLIAALEACASKREDRLPKKHGNIPL